MKSLDQMTQVTFTIGKAIKKFAELSTKEGIEVAAAQNEKLTDPAQMSLMFGAVN